MTIQRDVRNEFFSEFRCFFASSGSPPTRIVIFSVGVQISVAQGILDLRNHIGAVVIAEEVVTDVVDGIDGLI